MRAILAVFSASAILLGFTACESELPKRDTTLPSRITKGLRGEGTLYIPAPETTSPFSNPSPGQ